MTQSSLYDRVMDVVNRNESLYNRWENEIGARMALKWQAAFNVVDPVFPKVLETADMGADEVADHDEFVRTLNVILQKLADGNQLSHDGKWM